MLLTSVISLVAIHCFKFQESSLLPVKLMDVHVSIAGCTLFFYESDGRSGIDNNSIPKHAVWVENSIVQAVPEHPKKDFVFCLSNSLGDAFLFQVSAFTSQQCGFISVFVLFFFF